MQTQPQRQTKLQQQQDYNEDFEPLQESVLIANNRSRVRQMDMKRNSGNRQFGEYNQFDEKRVQVNVDQGRDQGLDIGRSHVLESNHQIQKLKDNIQARQERNQEIDQFQQADKAAEIQKSAKKQQDRQSLIKDTIERITKNINFSKQSIVEDITSINYYEKLNEKQLKSSYNQGSRIKKSKLVLNKKQGHLDPKKLEMREKQVVVQNQEKVVKGMKTKIAEKLRQEQKIKQIQKRRNKQIYEQQKQARKQQQLLEKSRSRMKKNQLEKRIIYQQKFVSRRSGSPEIPISNEEIKAFEDAFIQQIKERLNIGKNRKKGRSLSPQRQIKPTKVDPKANYKKIQKGQKLKEKIILNLKQRIQKQLEPTYQSILADSKQIEIPSTPDRKRAHQSAPQLRLPIISPTKPQRRTFYSKQQPNQRIHILKLSNNDL